MHERGARLPLVCACVGCGAAKNINQLETLDKIDVILYMQYFRCWWLGFAHTEPRLPAKIQDTIVFNHHRRRRRHWWQRRQHFRNDALREWWKRIWYARLLQSMPPMKGLWCAQKKKRDLFIVYSMEIWKDEWNEPKLFHFERHLQGIGNKRLEDFLLAGFISLRVCGRKENSRLWLTIVGKAGRRRVQLTLSLILCFATISHSVPQTDHTKKHSFHFGRKEDLW